MKGKKEGGEKKEREKKERERKKNRVPQQGSNPRPGGRIARIYYTCIYRRFRF